MLEALLVALAVVVLLTIAAAVAVFFQEAFGPGPAPALLTPKVAPPRRGAGLPDRPRNLANEFATSEARGNRAHPAAIMAVAVKGAISAVAARIAPPGPARRHKGCAHCRGQAILITAPEAMAIAEDLRQQCGPQALQGIRDRAQRCAGQGTATAPQAGALCPLLDAGGCCLVHATRPVFCRGRDIIGSMSDECSASGGDKSAPSAPLESLVAHLGEGMLIGLASALEDAHCDGRIYELNSALSAALGTPDSARRWTEGEPIFSACRTIEIPPR